MYNTLSVDALVSELTCLQSVIIDCNCASYLDLDRRLKAKSSHRGRGEQTWLSLGAREGTCCMLHVFFYAVRFRTIKQSSQKNPNHKEKMSRPAASLLRPHTKSRKTSLSSLFAGAQVCVFPVYAGNSISNPLVL